MTNRTATEAEAILDRFIEAIFRLMVERHQEQVLEMELTAPQAQTLRVLSRGPLCTRDLALALKISPPAVTQLTDRLARKQLLERRAASGDRRSVILSLSAKGRRVADECRERRNSLLVAAISGLGEVDRAEVTAALAKVVTALESLVSEDKETHSRGEIRIQVDEAGTANRSAESSNKTGRAKAPAGGRMKLEWD
jgi:DNA-binding MarR family transcriptional regulator